MNLHRQPQLMHLFRGVITSLILLGLVGCVDINKPDWARFAEISSLGWEPEDILFFEPLPADSIIVPTATYDFTLIMRTAMRNNVPLVPMAVTVEDADGVIRTDTLVIGAPDGPVLTVKKAYGVKESSFTLLKDTRLTDGFCITLSPLSEAARTKGILNIGLEMRRTK